MRIGIIGAGAAGFAAACAVKAQGHSAEIIDRWTSPRNLSTDNSEVGELSKLARKTKFGSSEMYIFDKRLMNVSPKLSLPISMTLGGLTSVWGANIKYYSAEEIGLPDSKHFNEASEALEELVPHMLSTQSMASFESANQSFLSKRLSSILASSCFDELEGLLTSSELAVDTQKCILCGECLRGCPTEAIFDAGLELTKLKDSEQIKSLEGFALKIYPSNGDTWFVEIETDSGEIIEREFDLIFIACGAIATTSLLQRSEIFPSYVTLDDTQVFYVPLITSGKKSHENSFTLSQMFYRNFDSNGGIHLSIYESSKDLKSRANLVLRGFEKLIPNFIWDHILAGIGFLPAKDSGKIVLQHENGLTNIDSILDSKQSAEFRTLIRKYLLKLRKFRLVPIIFLTKIPNVGASYHVGTARDSEGEQLVKINGAINDLERLFIVDATSLPILPTGPVTLPMMLNSYRIVLGALEEFR